jgi:2-keto-4-pentenoate hydratase
MNATNNETIERAGLAIREARATRKPIAQVSRTFQLSGIETAYQVAELNVQARLVAGHRIVGKKVGLTSLAVQKQLGVDQPDFGVLFEDMEYLSGADIPMSRLIQPKAEAEVAFVMSADLGPSAPNWCEFLAAVAYALPALEIVDSAIADWKITFFDTVADNASSALYVLGDQPVSVGSLQLADLRMTMRRGDTVVSEGVGSACLGHPLRAAWWLARTMAERGQPMRAGEVVMSGALGPMIPTVAGDRIVAEMGALGSVRCQFV